MTTNTVLVTLTKALLFVTGFAGVYFYRKWTAPPERKVETCFLAPNANAQLHVLKKESCSLKYCSFTSLSWVVAQIDSAEHSLDVMMYFLTYPEFTNAFLRAKTRGVRLRFVLQFDKSDEGSEWVRLRRVHIPIRMMNVPGSQLMHVKLLIIDKAAVVFGSMNFTFSGLTENHEELLRTNDEAAVGDCIEYFNRSWELITEHDQFHVQCRRNSGMGDRTAGAWQAED